MSAKKDADVPAEPSVVTPQSPETVTATEPADEQKWPPGAIPYHVDGVRVTWSEYAAHQRAEQKKAVLADLDAAAHEADTTPTNQPPAAASGISKE